MRFYPSAVLTYDDLVQSKFINRFQNGHMKTLRDYQALENWLKQPVVAIRQKPDLSETIVLMAPGRVYFDKNTHRRMAIIDGSLEDIKCIISDMAGEYCNSSPWDIFSWYQYNCRPFSDMNALTNWSTTLSMTPFNQQP